jgi:hypothetical protein
MFAVEAMCAAEAVLLRDSRDRKRLTGKAGGEDVVGGNRLGSDVANVACWHVAVPVLISFLRETVPLGGEDALAPKSFESDAETADAGEEVDEAKRL